MVEEGSPAPDFELTSDEGERVRLSELRGKPVVLYFYPRDDTPGCTAEACSFRDLRALFNEHGAEILGVSTDNVRSQKKNYGKTYMGIERSTFVIGADGNVTRVMRRVNPRTHADDVLAALGS